MDGDVERRGRPCTHIKYGLALAQMSSILLISIAIDHLNEIIQLLDNNKSKYAHKLFSDNFYKLALGQYLDISNIKDQEPTEILMEYKTATLYDIAFQLGYLLNDNIIIDKLGNLIDKSNLDKIISKEDIDTGNVANIKDLGIIYGKIFQLKDDFDDIEKDKKNKSNINYVLVNGKEKSIEKLNELSSKFNNFANELNIKLSNSVWGHSSINM
jgi:geranylgeranyl pyrophosphate synthase